MLKKHTKPNKPNRHLVCVQLQVRNKAILEGRVKQAFPFEEEPRLTLFQKPKKEKKKVQSKGHTIKGKGELIGAK